MAVLLAVEAWFSSRPPIVGHGPGQVPVNDKLAHVAYFALVGLLAARASLAGHGWSARRTAAVVVLGILAWGVLDEVHQSFTPGRAVEAGDVAADGVGAAAGVAAALALARRRA